MLDEYRHLFIRYSVKHNPDFLVFDTKTLGNFTPWTHFDEPCSQIGKRTSVKWRWWRVNLLLFANHQNLMQYCVTDCNPHQRTRQVWREVFSQTRIINKESTCGFGSGQVTFCRISETLRVEPKSCALKFSQL